MNISIYWKKKIFIFIDKQYYYEDEDLKFIINLDVRKEKLNETEIKEVVSEFDRMNKSVKIRKMK